MIFDGHSDILTDLAIRYEKGDRDPFQRHCHDLKKGGVDGGILVIWPEPSSGKGTYERTLDILQALNRELEKNSFRLVTRYSELDKYWQNELVFLLGAEGLSSIENRSGYIEELYRQGLRLASLTWNETNQLATGVSGDPNRGLTPLGADVVKTMERLGIILDVSHANEKTFWDISKIISRPIVASHSNLKSLCAHPRNLTDEQVKLIVETGGLIGINTYQEFISAHTDKKNIDAFVEQILETCNLAGVDHVGLGLDYFDYLEEGVVSSFSPGAPSAFGLENVSKSNDILSKLRDRQLSEEEIEKIAYKNWFRVIGEVIEP